VCNTTVEKQNILPGFTKAFLNANMVQCVWNELDYSIDICGVTRGSHMEHL
jgi:hypothetical protein